MVNLKKYDLAGKETGETAIDEKCLKTSASSQSIKEYIVAIQKNARQWSANTKGRSEIKATGKKPHPQKGLGRARQGTITAPQYKGGGIVFGPKPKFDMHVRINKKERQAAIRHLIAQKILDDKVCVLENGVMEAPKTKTVAEFFRQREMEKNRVLIIGESQSKEKLENLSKSVRNLPKKQFRSLSLINGYDLALCKDIVVMESALEELVVLLSKGSNE